MNARTPPKLMPPDHRTAASAPRDFSHVDARLLENVFVPQQVANAECLVEIGHKHQCHEDRNGTDERNVSAEIEDELRQIKVERSAHTTPIRGSSHGCVSACRDRKLGKIVANYLVMLLYFAR